MILSTTFSGDAKNFAWIIPTPTQPNVEKGSYELFGALEDLTRIGEERDYGYSGIGSGSAPMAVEKQAVTVLEQKKVDIYDITVLKSTDENALYDWLKKNGYQYPADGKYILDDYIQNDWIFTAVKVDTENLKVANSQLREGTANPLKLTFTSSKIVYPLKISSVTAKETTQSKLYYYGSDYVPIMLYVFADHKKQANNFEVQWANWVKKDKIEKLAYDSNGESWYTPQANKLYLTKLYASIETSEMKNDVFLTNAANNKSYPLSNLWPTILWALLFILVILVVSPLTLLYVIFMVLFIFIKPKTAKNDS